MTRHLIILNPASGKGAGDRSEPEIRKLWTGLGLGFDLVRTERPWHAAEIARKGVKEGYDVLVAAGGDGTANEVLNGLMQAVEAGEGSAALGLLGVGRGNDFAFGVGVPHDVTRDTLILKEGKKRIIDVGRVTGGRHPEGRYFCNGVGIGFDAVVGFEAARFKRLSGFPAYAVAAVRTIFLYNQAPVLRLEFNDESMDIPALMVSVMNGRRMGGGFLMAPEGLPDDGLLDLCIVTQVPFRTFPGLISRFTKGTQPGHRAVRMVRTTRIVVTSVSGSIPAHADGETLCESGESLAIELLPGRLEVISEG
ncbi:MAG TPA: diacylglycerol kinase family lipid kinase [bacterium]|nr:diacylglycerol kinase family lipid kinase [bacterium]